MIHTMIENSAPRPQLYQQVRSLAGSGLSQCQDSPFVSWYIRISLLLGQNLMAIVEFFSLLIVKRFLQIKEQNFSLEVLLTIKHISVDLD